MGAPSVTYPRASASRPETWAKAAGSSFKYESEPSGSVDLYIFILEVVPAAFLNFRPILNVPSVNSLWNASMNK